MDKLAIAGLFIAISAIFGGYAVEGGGVSALFQLPAFIIVFGGTFGAVMLQTPKSDFIHGITLFPLIWKSPKYDFNLYKLKLNYEIFIVLRSVIEIPTELYLNVG